MPHAVMGGSGWAADADLVGGTAHIGDIVPKQLPCQGTDGQTRTKALASATIPGVTLGDLPGQGQRQDHAKSAACAPGPRAPSRTSRSAPATRR